MLQVLPKKVDQIVLSLELGMKEKSLVKICPRSDLEKRKIYREIVCDIGKNVLWRPANKELFWLEVKLLA